MSLVLFLVMNSRTQNKTISPIANRLRVQLTTTNLHCFLFMFLSLFFEVGLFSSCSFLNSLLSLHSIVISICCIFLFVHAERLTATSLALHLRILHTNRLQNNRNSDLLLLYSSLSLSPWMHEFVCIVVTIIIVKHLCIVMISLNFTALTVCVCIVCCVWVFLFLFCILYFFCFYLFINFAFANSCGQYKWERCFRF